SESITIARPYAKAAFEFAVERNVIEHWLTMLNFMAKISADNQMKQLIDSGMSADELSKIFIDVCGDNIDEFTGNFVKTMASNGRLLLLPDVFTLFADHCSEKNDIADVTVISATTLSEDQLNKIAAAMEKKLAKKVNLICQLDAS